MITLVFSSTQRFPPEYAMAIEQVTKLRQWRLARGHAMLIWWLVFLGNTLRPLGGINPGACKMCVRHWILNSGPHLVSVWTCASERIDIKELRRLLHEFVDSIMKFYILCPIYQGRPSLFWLLCFWSCAHIVVGRHSSLFSRARSLRTINDKYAERQTRT